MRIFSNAFLTDHEKTSTLLTLKSYVLKDKSGIDKIIVEKQPYQLLNTNFELFPRFDASNFPKLVNESS